MDNFHKGFFDELEKIGVDLEGLGRAIGQPIRSVGEAVSAAPGKAQEFLAQQLGAVGGGAEDFATGLGEQSGITQALRTAVPEMAQYITPEAAIGAGLGGLAGAAGGGYLGGEAGGIPGGIGGAALGGLGGAALGGLGAGAAGQAIRSSMLGQELAQQAEQAQREAGMVHGLRALRGGRMQAGRQAAADQAKKLMGMGEAGVREEAGRAMADEMRSRHLQQVLEQLQASGAAKGLEAAGRKANKSKGKKQLVEWAAQAAGQ